MLPFSRTQLGLFFILLCPANIIGLWWDTTISPMDVPMDVSKDAEWYVPASSFSLSHGWRYPPFPEWMDRARYCLGDPPIPIVLPPLHTSLCPPVTRAQHGAGTALQPCSVPWGRSGHVPSTPWSLLGLGAGFALLAVPSCRAVGSPLVMDPNSICRKTKRLAGKQAELCQLEPEIVQEVAKGTKLGVRECQYQFRFRRWNCTSHSKYFGKILQQDIRETAFVYAITAAGVSHAITQACSMGELLQCGCELTRSRAPPSPTAGPGMEGTAWEWGGCGDDVQFGYEKSQQFMDAKNKKGKNDIRALIDLHNNEAGRLAVRSYMRTECKCHGLSGSCTLRTCWRKMPHFREVGDRLLERFNGAFKVMGGNDGKTLIPVGDNIKPPDKQDLIYSADSPDFCSANRKTGSLGTRGRVCNSTAMDTSGCDLLCCGRGHRDETVVLEENCLCRFHWCCVVQCRKCSVRQELSLCI
ncbi:protein Wnt-6 isoform X2 [Parus major]|uniref:protein Wnt-6 isoform X2 n=1 Tax=Parus major TaxID=9157 RepID=UPI00077122A6|nr:protein Wnt-6 isoform X2 [Parus major]